jgi:hypothetical protein
LANGAGSAVTAQPDWLDVKSFITSNLSNLFATHPLFAKIGKSGFKGKYAKHT